MRLRLKEKLVLTLQNEELRQVYNSFDIIGDIALIKTLNFNNAQAVGEEIMQIHKGLRSVFLQASPITGEHRTRKLELLTGENITVTKHKEAGCTFLVDVGKCYFSPRLSHERSRIARSVKSGEIIVNMFSGVGCFSIIIAKTIPNSYVYSIDINPTAYQYMVENIRINRVYGRVFPMFGDSKKLVQAKLMGTANRILMPLPELALQYLPTAISALKKEGGWIHYYDFQHAMASEDPVQKTKRKVADKLSSLGTDFTFGVGRVVRSTGPNWYQTVLDIQVASLPSKF